MLSSKPRTRLATAPAPLCAHLGHYPLHTTHLTAYGLTKHVTKTTFSGKIIFGNEFLTKTKFVLKGPTLSAAGKS